MANQNLFRRWLGADPVRAKDLAAANLLDKLETLAAELEAEDIASVDGWMVSMYLGDPAAALTPERLEEYHLEVLDGEAARLLKEWALDQITPTAAKGLAALANTPGLYDTQITLRPSIGPEYVSNVLNAWTERHPGVVEAIGTEDGTRWRSAAIPIKEYAAMHGRTPVAVRKLAERGSLKTARKVGRDWLVNPDEPYPDNRRRDNGNGND